MVTTIVGVSSGSCSGNTSVVGVVSLSVVKLIVIMTVMTIVLTTTNALVPTVKHRLRPWITRSVRALDGRDIRQSRNLHNSNIADDTGSTSFSTSKGRLLVLGGTGYLGQEVCKKAIQEGYSVVTLSRRGTPSSSSSSSSNIHINNNNRIDYRKGDARQKESITNILQEGDICGIVHCIGLLFDTQSGLGSYNVYVSGSKSLPDKDSTYDSITRQTAFNAIDATIEYVQSSINDDTIVKPIPFCFTSAAEAGWPDVLFGNQIECIMPQFIHRYMVAKRAVEQKLLSSPSNIIRPIIVRPSLIYTKNQLASIPAVTTFTILNQIGLPFVDRPVTVDSLSTTIIKSMSDSTIRGIQRYQQIDQISSATK